MWLSHNFSGILSANKCFSRWGNVSAQYFFSCTSFFCLFEKIFFDFFCNKMVVLNFLIFYYKRSIYT